MFQLKTTPLEQINLREGFTSPSAGAFNVFEGWVRDHNDGRKVSKLEYEAVESLCIKEAFKIFQDAKANFSIIDCRCFHRIGELNVGEMAVWVGVIATHRDDSFKACRYIIDEIKHRLPIWKKEYYENGTSEWINCQNCHAANTSDLEIKQNEYYSKQIKLNEIGLEGQKRLKQAKVLVVGAGGLGSTALDSLVSAGVGLVGICEHDDLEVSNLHRQTIYSAQDVGKPKIELAYQRMTALNPLIALYLHPKKITAINVKKILNSYDIVLDCTDNFETKFLLNDACYLMNKSLVQSSIYQFEGQLRVQIPQKSPCLRCLWSDIPDTSRIGTCEDVGVLGIVPNLFGHLQALEAMKIILGMDVVVNETIIFNLKSYQWRSIKQKYNPQCPLCGENPTIKTIESFNYEKQSSDDDMSFDLGSIERNEMDHYTWVDIREPIEMSQEPIEDVPCIKWPLSRYRKDHYPFDQNKKYILVCAKGQRSQHLSQMLQKQGIHNVYSLKNGVEAFKILRRNNVD